MQGKGEGEEVEPKSCCIWFSKLRNSWILDIDEPGDRRVASEEEGVRLAKAEGCVTRYDPDNGETTPL
jgi:hypothetical protein